MLFLFTFVCMEYPFDTGQLAHWGRMMHICVSKLTTIGSDYSLSPGRHQTIISTNALSTNALSQPMLIGRIETNFSKILIEIRTFSFKKIHF